MISIKLKTLCFTVLLLLVGRAQADTALLNERTYVGDAIREAPMRVRPDLMRCVKQWERFKERQDRYAGLKTNSKGDLTIALELGDTGYGRYDIIVLDNLVLKSSFPKGDVAASETLLDLFRELRIENHNELTDAGTPSEDDGECYFITVKEGSKERSVAIYGSPQDSKIGLIAKEMLRLVR